MPEVSPEDGNLEVPRRRYPFIRVATPIPHQLAAADRRDSTASPDDPEYLPDPLADLGEDQDDDPTLVFHEHVGSQAPGDTLPDVSPGAAIDEIRSAVRLPSVLPPSRPLPAYVPAPPSPLSPSGSAGAPPMPLTIGQSRPLPANIPLPPLEALPVTLVRINYKNIRTASIPPNWSVCRLKFPGIKVPDLSILERTAEKLGVTILADENTGEMTLTKTKEFQGHPKTNEMLLDLIQRNILQVYSLVAEFEIHPNSFR